MKRAAISEARERIAGYPLGGGELANKEKNKHFTSREREGRISLLGFGSMGVVLPRCRAGRICCRDRRGWKLWRLRGSWYLFRLWGVNKHPLYATGRNCGIGSWRALRRVMNFDPWRRCTGTKSRSKCQTWESSAEMVWNNLIVAPRQHHIIKTAVRLVNATFSWVKSVMGIGVVLERFRVDDLVGKFAPNDYGTIIRIERRTIKRLHTKCILSHKLVGGLKRYYVFYSPRQRPIARLNRTREAIFQDRAVSQLPWMDQPPVPKPEM